MTEKRTDDQSHDVVFQQQDQIRVYANTSGTIRVEQSDMLQGTPCLITVRAVHAEQLAAALIAVANRIRQVEK